MATPFHLLITAAQVGTYFVGQYYQVLRQQLDFVHQFYSEASTILCIDGTQERQPRQCWSGIGNWKLILNSYRDIFEERTEVANFEYIDEVEAAAEEEARKASTENKTTTNNPDRASYWEELLKDRYEVHKVEEFNAMGKGNRSRKQWIVLNHFP